jgi:hypothetical protein
MKLDKLAFINSPREPVPCYQSPISTWLAAFGRFLTHYGLRAETASRFSNKIECIRKKGDWALTGPWKMSRQKSLCRPAESGRNLTPAKRGLGTC